MISIKFKNHALNQFSNRLSIPFLHSAEKMRKIWDYAEEISREEAIQITSDREIFKKRNKTTRYFKVDLKNPVITKILYEDNCPLKDETVSGLFVVREGYVVTFKTTLELEIWRQLNGIIYGI